MSEVVLSTLIGGFLALLGAFAGPFLQRKHDRWLAMRADHQILREKAEELFNELDSLGDQSARASIRILERLKDDNLDALPVPDLGRIRAISTVYFPKLLPCLDSYQVDLKAIHNRIIPDIGKAGEASDARKINALGVMLVFEHQEASSKLIKDIRSEMVELAPKFQDHSSL